MKTKSYYDKKGNSITKKEFQMKLQAYKKKQKSSTQESSWISDYLKDKLVVEHFTPKKDITEYLKSRF